MSSIKFDEVKRGNIMFTLSIVIKEIEELWNVNDVVFVTTIGACQ